MAAVFGVPENLLHTVYQADDDCAGGPEDAQAPDTKPRRRKEAAAAAPSRPDGFVPTRLRAGEEEEVTEEFVKALFADLCRVNGLRARLVEPYTAMQIVRQATALFAQEPVVVDVPLPASDADHITVVGDIHGQFEDLSAILRRFGPLAAGEKRGSLVFLGDLVDRGGQQTQVILTVAALKVAYPGRVHVCRGNHEDDPDDFPEVVQKVYGEHGAAVGRVFGDEFEGGFVGAFKRMFAEMPLACVIPPPIGVFCCHGGPPARGNTLSELRTMRKDGPNGVAPRAPPGAEQQLQLQRREVFPVSVYGEVMWNDPRAQDGVCPNAQRGFGFEFGPDVAAAFLDSAALRCAVRSHEMVPGGYSWQTGSRVLTVFSASQYHRQDNRGAVAQFSASAPGSARLHTFVKVSKPWDGIYDFYCSDDSDSDSKDTCKDKFEWSMDIDHEKNPEFDRHSKGCCIM